MFLIRRKRRETILDIYNVALGAFLFACPWLFAFTREAARLDAWAMGLVIAAMAIAAVVTFAEWEEWVNLALGLWLLASPFLLGFAHTPAMRVDIGVGFVVAYLAALEIWLIHYAPTTSTSTT